MTDINYTAASEALGGARAGLLDRVRTMLDTLAERRQLRAAERELNALDDRMLEDIGVPRGEIHHRVWGGGR